MAYDITAIDGAVIFEDANEVKSLPNNQYRANFQFGNTDKIAILSADVQSSNLIIRLEDVADVSSITDNRTGGAGVIAVPGTLKGIYDIINPFFFRKPIAGGGGVTPWLGLNGLKQAGAQNIGSAFEYNPAGGQEMFTDGNIHGYQNFFETATNSWYGNAVQDYTTIVGPTEFDDLLGVYPENIKQQVYDPTGLYHEQYDWVATDDFSYFAEDYMYVEKGLTPDAYRGLGAVGVDLAGNDFNGYLQVDRGSTSFTSDYVDGLGNNISMGMIQNPTERTGMQRVEDDGIEILEQAFDFFGTASGFGERFTRFYHVASGGLLRRLYFTDDIVRLERQRIGGASNTRIELSETGFIYEGDTTYETAVSQNLGGGTFNNLFTAGLEESSQYDINTIALSTITGIQAPSPLRRKDLRITNTGGVNLTLSNNNASSLANNRFLMNGTEILQSNESVHLRYDTGANRWRVVAIYQ